MYLSGNEMRELLADLERADPRLAAKWKAVFTSAAWLRRNFPEYPKGGPQPTLWDRMRFLFGYGV